MGKSDELNGGFVHDLSIVILVYQRVKHVNKKRFPTDFPQPRADDGRELLAQVMQDVLQAWVASVVLGVFVDCKHISTNSQRIHFHCLEAYRYVMIFHDISPEFDTLFRGSPTNRCARNT